MNEKVEQQAVTFEIKNLSVVLFQCRSLEKRLITYPIDLTGNRTEKKDLPPEYHLALVNQTMKQFSKERLLEYLEDLRREGNRESDYSNDNIEATLVFDLPKDKPQYIQDFINMVNRKLPNLYRWFAPISMHMTVRALL